MIKVRAIKVLMNLKKHNKSVKYNHLVLVNIYFHMTIYHIPCLGKALTPDNTTIIIINALFKALL